MKILLQRGAGVDSKDKDNITALMEASIMDHRDVVKYLLKVPSTAMYFHPYTRHETRVETYRSSQHAPCAALRAVGFMQTVSRLSLVRVRR